MIQRQRLIYVQAYDVDALIEISDKKLEKYEAKGWKLADMRAYIAPNNEDISIIKMIFAKHCFLNPEPNINLKNSEK